MARILVIEDNMANLELMLYLLEAFGHTPLSAADGASGVAAAQAEQLELIICDIQLPDFDGYAVARQLKADPRLRDIPLVAVTAFAMVGDRDQILAAGFDGYLAKPIVPEMFVGQVEAFLPPAQRSAALPTTLEMTEPEMAHPVPPHRATILVVDDTLANHELMRSILEPFGYTVITANSVREALELARAHPPDLIVSDMHMPDQTGFDLLRALHADAELRGIKTVVHSATLRSEIDRREALRLGAVAVITRPMDPMTILKELELHLPAQSE